MEKRGSHTGGLPGCTAPHFFPTPPPIQMNYKKKVSSKNSQNSRRCGRLQILDFFKQASKQAAASKQASKQASKISAFSRFPARLRPNRPENAKPLV